MESYGLFALPAADPTQPTNYLKIVHKPETLYNELLVEIDGDTDFSNVYDTAMRMSSYLRKVIIKVSLPTTRSEVQCLQDRVINVLKRLTSNSQLKDLSFVDWALWRWPLEVKEVNKFICTELRPFFAHTHPLSEVDLSGLGVNTQQGVAILLSVAYGSGHTLTTLQLMDFFIPEDVCLKTRTNGNFIYVMKRFRNLRAMSINNYAICPKILETIAWNNQETFCTLVIQCKDSDPTQTQTMHKRVWTKVFRICPTLRVHLCLKNISSKKRVCELLPKDFPLETLEFWQKYHYVLEPPSLKPYSIPKSDERYFNWLLEYIYDNFRETLTSLSLHFSQDSGCLSKVALLKLLTTDKLSEIEIEGKIYTSVLDSLCNNFPQLCKTKNFRKLHLILLFFSKDEKERFERRKQQYQSLRLAIPDFKLVLKESI